MSRVVVCDHPLVKHHLVHIRDHRTDTASFRFHVERIAELLALEATRASQLQQVEVITALELTTGSRLAKPDIIIVPILRAGLGLVQGFTHYFPQARIGHIGLARNEHTLQPQQYYVNLPTHSSGVPIYVLDPMLATAGSAIAAIQLLKDRGYKDLTMICIIAAPEGVAKFQQVHPDVVLICASIDTGLNQQGYIVPGLGDAGDRMFGTV